MKTRLSALIFVVVACSATFATASPRAQSTKTTDTATGPMSVTTVAAGMDEDEPPTPKELNWPDGVGSPEQVLYAQARMMQDAIGKLRPRTPGKTNLYLIEFAGDGEENVFRNEVDYVEKLFSQRFDDAGRVLALVNNPTTLPSRPIASLSNLEIAVDALTKKMDTEQDVLMLFVTTHGSNEHELYVSLDPLPLDQIAPEDLRGLFADSKIKHRVFVISACYSGAYVDALKNDDSMVITAARSDRASFGCGSQSDITDFGRAFFVEALNHTASFTQAFAEARKLIDTWETRDGEDHSYPQMSSTPHIEAALKAWTDGIKVGPAVPFPSGPSKPRLRTPEKPAEQTVVSVTP